MSVRARVVGSFLGAALLGGSSCLSRDTDKSGGVGSRVLVVERQAGALAVYDLDRRALLPGRIPGLGILGDAPPRFSPSLRHAYVAGSGISRIDLVTLERTDAAAGPAGMTSGELALSQDGRFLAAAAPGEVILLDAATLQVVGRIRTEVEREGRRVEARALGLAGVLGNRFACLLDEAAEVWVIDASRAGFPVEHRIRTLEEHPSDGMATPDGRFYVAARAGSSSVSVVDLAHPERKARRVMVRDAGELYEPANARTPPNLAAWAVTQDRVFIPVPRQPRLAVLRRWTWQYEGTVPVRGYPSRAFRAPGDREVWVTFAGAGEDHVEVVDTARLEVKRAVKVGRGATHLEFTPRGGHVLVTVAGEDRLVLVNTTTYEIEDTEPLRSPGGAFGVWRASAVVQ